MSTMIRLYEENDPDIEMLSSRYKKTISDKKLRECILGRNIVLTMLAQEAIMQSKINALQASNVPAVFIVEAVAKHLVYHFVDFPDFGGAPLEIAKKCQPFPNYYLTPDELRYFHLNAEQTNK